MFLLFYFTLIKCLYPISTSNFNVQKLSLESVQSKKSRDGNKFQNIPILYDAKKARVRLSGRFQVKELGDLSLIVQVDDDNRKVFEEFEVKLWHLSGDCPLKLIRGDSFYLKIYTKPNGKNECQILAIF